MQPNNQIQDEVPKFQSPTFTNKNSIVKKEFTFSDIYIQYSNKFKITQLCAPEEQSHNEEVKIKTELKRLGSNTMINETVICIGGQRICIQDQLKQEQIFNKQFLGRKIAHMKRKKNMFLVNRKPYIPVTQYDLKRDLKNNVKNIVRLFHKWIIEVDFDGKENARRRFQEMLTKQSQNNKLIRAFTKDQIIGQVFKAFLSNNAQKYINDSRIIDKATHIKVIQFYLSLYKENSPEQIDCK